MKDRSVITGSANLYRVYKNSPLSFDEIIRDFKYLWKRKKLDEKLHQLREDDIHKFNQFF